MANGQPSGMRGAVGDLLRRYREAAGLSQEALAERAGVSPRGLLYLERGMRRPYPATLRRLADALALTAQEREALTQALQSENTAGPPAAPEPPVSLLPGPTHNLPVALSSFIGREQAQARVRDLLTAHRLVTLTGAGGVGKTRLALAVATGRVDAFPDGIWWVELAALADPALVPGTVALALGLREEPGRPILEVLRLHCRGKHMLLVLDNCEHLRAACSALAGILLRAALELRILATSREALRVAGEHSYRVPSLSVPDPEHLPSPELAGSFEAVRLFVARAQEQRDTFTLAEHNARPVAEICARLDGVPLAIELAAARINSMTAAAIATRLDDRFRLLTIGADDLPTRQRTLRATLDWSWDLLDDGERTLLSRLSVFAGGWTLEAAAPVCLAKAPEQDGSPEQAAADPWAVVNGLDRLISRSLVQMDETPEGVARYRLLESVRQYAGEQLITSGQERAIRDSHLAYFLDLAEQAIQAFRGANIGSWLDRLEADHDNMRAALSWAVAQAKGDEGLRLAAALAPFWEFRGHIAEGRRRLEEILAVAQGSPTVRARALNVAGNLVLRAGDSRAALALYEESLALRREIGDRAGMAASLTNVANAHFALGEYEQAGPPYAEALELYRAVGDQWGVATAFNNQAETARALGQYTQADELANHSLALRREQHDPRGIAETTIILALIAADQHRYDQAATLYREGLLLSREIGDMLRLLEALEGLAWSAAALGQARWAARIGGAAEAERERLGLPRNISEHAYSDKAREAMREALGEAGLVAAWAEGRGVTLAEAIALALEGAISTE